ncbi:hypothetical protein HYS91_02260 [Candidatus Daviesbacteria bacterium]|nr:hypothetical protein [Candidatus Daviesbacteria bacterium]
MIAKLLVSSDLSLRIREIDKILNISNLSRGHPDLLYLGADEKLGVEKAKLIRDHFSLRPYSAKGRAVALENASNLTLEAQNGLLKTLEEPPLGAILLLGVPSEFDLLPTIVSRAQVIYLNAVGGEQVEKFAKDIEKLITLNLEKRFEFIEKLEEKEEFLKALTIHFRKKLHKDPKWIDFVKELVDAQHWAKSNVNIRGILEYLMLKMPS